MEARPAKWGVAHGRLQSSWCEQWYVQCKQMVLTVACIEKGMAWLYMVYKIESTEPARYLATSSTSPEC